MVALWKTLWKQEEGRERKREGGGEKETARGDKH